MDKYGIDLSLNRQIAKKMKNLDHTIDCYNQTDWSETILVYKIDVIKVKKLPF
jgi:hypothetical protein